MSMKKAIFILGVTAALSACNSGNDNTTASTTTDTASQSAQGGMASDTTAMTTGTDTTAMAAGQSMMLIMQRNMDQMKSMQSTGDPDKDFASMMKAHHTGAIEMARAEVAQGTDTQLKQMAQKMIEEQQKEITDFDAFLSSNTKQANDTAQGRSDAFHQQVMGQMNNMKMDMDHSGSMDKQFAQMMISHHQGGIDMAKAYLKTGAREQKLKTLANNIITDQQKEINDLQAWIAKNK